MHFQNEQPTPSSAPQLQFVSVLGPKGHGSSKEIRTQVMRDYIWKLKNKAVTKPYVTVTSVKFGKPGKSRFRLDPSVGGHKDEDEKKKSKINTTNGVVNKTKKAPRTPVGFGLQMECFDTFSHHLKPFSKMILHYYQTTYSMNSIAVNADGTFFTQARSDPALLYSVLHLVALHRDLKSGASESLHTLYHGGEAFRIINERLRNEKEFSDMTIVAVAMLANKENLNGKYELSRMHIKGLMSMVATRGGISCLSGVFLKIVTWADFCFANIWESKPSFPRQNLAIDISPDDPKLEASLLDPKDIFNSNSPINNIVRQIRYLVLNSSLKNQTPINKMNLSNRIYHLEYDLLTLNHHSPTNQSSHPINHLSSFETSLKIAIHILLHLVIREIPPSSQAISRMALRLRTSLEPSLYDWWNSSSEYQTWLLWILFVGSLASTDGEGERKWFVENMMVTADLLGISDEQGLRRRLGMVLLVEGFYEEGIRGIQKSVEGLREGSGRGVRLENVWVGVNNECLNNYELGYHA